MSRTLPSEPDASRAGRSRESSPGAVVAGAALADLAALVLFVALGRREHESGGGLSAFLSTLWPFVVGWFGAAAVVRLDRAPRAIGRAAATWAIAIPIALALRITVGGHDFRASFAIVAASFVALFTLGWRLVLRALERRRVPSG